MVNYSFIKNGTCLLSDITKIEGPQGKRIYRCANCEFIQSDEENKTVKDITFTRFDCKCSQNGKLTDFYPVLWRAFMYRLNGDKYFDEFVALRTQENFPKTIKPKFTEKRRFNQKIQAEKLSMLRSFAFFNQVDFELANHEKGNVELISKEHYITNTPTKTNTTSVSETSNCNFNK